MVEALRGFAAALSHHCVSLGGSAGKSACGLLGSLAVPGRSDALPGMATVPACVREKARGAVVAGSACVLLGRLMRVRAAEALLGIAVALARHVRQRAWDCCAGSARDLPEEGGLLLLFDCFTAALARHRASPRRPRLLWSLDPEGLGRAPARASVRRKTVSTRVEGTPTPESRRHRRQASAAAPVM